MSKLFSLLVLLWICITYQCRKAKYSIFVNSRSYSYLNYKFIPLTDKSKHEINSNIRLQNKRALKLFKNESVEFPYMGNATNWKEKTRNRFYQNRKRVYSEDNEIAKNESNEPKENEEKPNVIKEKETVVRPEVVEEKIDVKSEIEPNIIAQKILHQKNEVIKKLKLPITGTQLKPSGGYTKEILELIKQSNEYVNIINEEIIKKKINDKIKQEDLSFFDDEQSIEEQEVNYLTKIYDNNYVLNIYNFLLVWKKKKNMDLSVFVTKITETTNMLPGERTVIKFSEIEKAQFLKKIKNNRNVCVAMIFVDNKNRKTDPSNSSESESTIMHNMYPIGVLAHPLDISLLDKSGEISVLNLFRYKINSYRVTETDFLVNAELFTDPNRKLNNWELTLENKKIILNLYDKLLNLKIKYNEKIGNTHENEKLKLLEKITERIDEYINVLTVNKSINLKGNSLDFYTSLYLEYFSFLALDINADIQTKLQIMYTDNTELRLHNVKTYLLQLYDDLKLKLRGL